MAGGAAARRAFFGGKRSKEGRRRQGKYRLAQPPALSVARGPD
jgi:hypothetical protein